MNFQITLLNYKLDFQNKNMIFFKLKKKKKKKKHHRTREARVMRLVYFILLFKGQHLFEPDFFFSQNTHISLGLSRDKTKG